ncbi:uncharacterized protein A4U43_C07F25000 [Asparagus officinalis]|uniref:Hexosyltransferase n=1 Tax=Asparagus officinalis TaxID=4686 RepID=A0A5P1EJX9_ASPOF|nr:uncharacterized protein A4U43_C07F25000 [Asparagus officinalis]
MMKNVASKSTAIKANLILFAFFLVVYAAILLQPPPFVDLNATSSPQCPLNNCLMMKKVSPQKMQVESKMAMKTVAGVGETSITSKKELPAIFKSLQGQTKNIGLINIGDDDRSIDWQSIGETTIVTFERVSDSIKWKDLFPEWIDEEEEHVTPSCPEVPMPDFSLYEEVDVVVARVPCRRPKEGWSRDVHRLQVHLVAVNMAVRRGRRDGKGRVRVVVESECRPMMDVLRCDDVVGREGRWWMFEVEGVRLEEKVALPVGSCKLALPLWEEGTHEEYDITKLHASIPPPRREALRHRPPLLLHLRLRPPSPRQSILHTGTTRDLILLHDSSLSNPASPPSPSAGWKLHLTTRIRNPHAHPNSYNEYNFTKLRLWLHTYYRKLIFIDSDILVLKNLDLLFTFPQLSAVGNDGVIFNSGIMVIEPSKCTFKTLMRRQKEIVSYNGGDQGYLNEVFVWWHRLPRRVNFLKNFWSNKTEEAMFRSDPPMLYSIHYLGLKPWLCYREYDCNWNLEDHKVFASDVAHRKWWEVYDRMDERLKGFCGLSKIRRQHLEEEREKAERLGFGDGHWRIKVE